MSGSTKEKRVRKPRDKRSVDPYPGRKRYRKDYHPLKIHELTLLGLPLEKVADILEIAPRTLYKWAEEKPEVKKAVSEGRDLADARVVHSLYKRALGVTISLDQVVKLRDSDGNERVETVTLKKEVPPDTQAAAIWLRSRQRDIWAERQELDINQNMNVNIVINNPYSPKVIEVSGRTLSPGDEDES